MLSKVRDWYRVMMCDFHDLLKVELERSLVSIVAILIIAAHQTSVAYCQRCWWRLWWLLMQQVAVLAPLDWYYRTCAIRWQRRWPATATMNIEPLGFPTRSFLAIVSSGGLSLLSGQPSCWLVWLKSATLVLNKKQPLVVGRIIPLRWVCYSTPVAPKQETFETNLELSNDEIKQTMKPPLVLPSWFFGQAQQKMQITDRHGNDST